MGSNLYVKLRYTPVYAKVAGTVASGVLLEHLLEEWNGEEFPIHQTALCTKMGMTSTEFRKALSRLKRIGVIEVRVVGVRPMKMCRVREEKLQKLIDELEKGECR